MQGRLHPVIRAAIAKKSEELRAKKLAAAKSNLVDANRRYATQPCELNLIHVMIAEGELEALQGAGSEGMKGR